MFKIVGLKKIYNQGKEEVEALKNINLTIPPGCIFGVIGLSGAGKSSLLRCLNRLEEPTSGAIYFHDRNILTFNKAELREYRKNVGMIFQHFHLLSRRTVYQNIAFPLEIAGVDQKEKDKRIKELLELVGLSHKIHSYPSQLSGGEKQRVGIARALANNPEVLLCDEATSALDPQTTHSILSLLKEINRKYNITIIMITHQMEVIKETCHRVAVIDDGEIVEEGTVLKIFSAPENKLTRSFVLEKNIELPRHYMESRRKDTSNRLLRLFFPPELSDKPIISHIIKEYDVDANILAGNINFIEDNAYGQLVVELLGDSNKVEMAYHKLQDLNLKVEVIENGTLHID